MIGKAEEKQIGKINDLVLLLDNSTKKGINNKLLIEKDGKILI
jgi:hypothetical protein